MWTFDAELHTAKKRFSDKKRILHSYITWNETGSRKPEGSEWQQLRFGIIWQIENIITATEVVAWKQIYLKMVISCWEGKYVNISVILICWRGDVYRKWLT